MRQQAMIISLHKDGVEHDFYEIDNPEGVEVRISFSRNGEKILDKIYPL